MNVASGVSSRYLGGDVRESDDVDSERRERIFAELVLPEMLASCMAAPRERTVLPFSLLMLSSARAGASDEGQVAESWRPRGGGLTGTLDARVRDVGKAGAGGGDSDGQGRLITQIEAGELGRIRLVVERTDRGLKVSLGVDNPETAASAEMQRSLLEQSLRASGLTVASVTISRGETSGTVLAQSSLTHPSDAAAASIDEHAPGGTSSSGAPRTRKRLNVTG